MQKENKHFMRIIPKEIEYLKKVDHAKGIICHTSDYSYQNENGYLQTPEIEKWHLANGWDGIGYDFVIERKGGLYATFRYLENITPAHCKGHNDTIGICFAGKGDTEHLSHEQLETFKELFKNLKKVYPSIKSFHYHNEYSTKTCPGKKVIEDLEKLK